MKVHPAGLAAAIAATVLGTGCASAPKNTQLTADQWRAAAPLQLEFRVYEPTALLPYEPMGSSATASGLGSQGAPLVLMTLPVWLAVDAGRLAAQGARKQQSVAGNRRLSGWRDAIDKGQFEQAFERGVSEALPCIELVLSAALPDARARSGKVLAGSMHFSLRSDGRALLVHTLVRLQAVPTEALACEGFMQCARLGAVLRDAPFTAHFFYHSAVLPAAAAVESEAGAAWRSDPLAQAFDARRRGRTPASPARTLLHGPESYAPLWLANDAQRLREAFADAAASVQRLTRIAIANESLPPKDAVTLGHVLFPYAYDDVKFAFVQEEGGRRVLRSRASPVRGVFGSADRAAGHWFDVPANAGEKDEPYTSALLEMARTLPTAYRDK